jgi:hypothetical protein
MSPPISVNLMAYLPMKGICEDEFHKNAHGVLSPLYGRRYSLVLYPNKGALLQLRLKKAGSKVWQSKKQRNAFTEQFTKARGGSSALCLCSCCHSDCLSFHSSLTSSYIVASQASSSSGMSLTRNSH